MFQCVRQTNAIPVDKAARLFEIEVSGTGRRSEQTFAETGPFLISPVDKPHCDRRFAPVLVVDPPEDLDSSQQVEATVQPATVWDRINVTTDQQRLLGFSTQCG